ncbi:MAG: DUF2163 domain-containing protein [Pseudomonadota bacterium]
MRKLPEGLAQGLASGATTLARCWRLARTDGVVMGFTDHDRGLSFEGVEFAAGAGFEAGAVERSTGLSADSHSVTGALQSAAITEADISRGLYDSAEVTLWLVDWRDVANRVRLSTGRIGEIRRSETAFEVEIVGLAEALNQKAGRVYHPRCDLRLGEPRCGVDITDPAFVGAGAVTAVTGSQRILASGLDGFDNGWFTEGALRWTGGANAGTQGHVKLHRPAFEGAALELWLAPGAEIAPGDPFEVIAGCDKRAATCREKFSNFLNFRGFPHMPGDDFAAGYPSGGGHDGGSLLSGG